MNKRGYILISITFIILTLSYFKISSIKVHILKNTSEMIETNLKIGDRVKTKGYYEENDNGAATYEIMSYEQWYKELPDDLKAVAYVTDQLGNPVWSKTIVDGYGNHTLNNGLVAKIVNDGVITPEQWGCIGDGITDNTEQLIHLFSFTKSGYIKFKKNATYLMKSRTENRKGKSNNEYIWLMCGAITGGASQGKPVMANINGVILDGNNCTIKINTDDFSQNTNDFGMFQFSGVIKYLEIKNFNFDGNGLSLLNQNVRTTNHTLVYLPSSMNAIQLNNGTGEIAPNIPNKDKESEFSNVNIHDNYFKNSGTAIDIQDGGGDFILLINPKISHDVYIENNTFENWGRWVFSVDLGGEGECFENYKFNSNICIQNNDNKLGNGKYRGLGWIDFESKKCWSNLEIKNNYVEGLNCFAINGAGKVSENIIISDNTIKRIDRNYKSAYPYMFEFYGVEMKNLNFENNNIEASGSYNFGYTLNNINIKNNTISSPIQLKGLYGDIIVDGNVKADKGALIQILGLSIPTYINESEKLKCKFSFINNEGGVEGARGQAAMFFNPDFPGKYSYIDIIIEGNKSKLFNIVSWDAENFQFNPSQVEDEVVFAVRGAKFTDCTFTKEVNNPVVGGGIYNKGDIITNNLNKCSRLEEAYFYQKLNFKEKNILKCSESGYLPTGGEFLLCNGDKAFRENMKVNKYDHIYDKEKLYIVCNSGQLGKEINDSLNYTISGDVRLLYITKLAEAEAVK